MRILAVVYLQLAIWVTGQYAFYPYVPNYLCDEDPTCNAAKRREVVPSSQATDRAPRTFKLTRKINESKKSSVSGEVERVRRKYARTTPSRTQLGKRTENNYPVVKADTPTLEHSEGINQDGTDFSYFIEVGFGSSQTPMYMLVDTGAGTTWVMGSNCKSTPCTAHRTFSSDDSTSLKTTTQTFSISYGSGSVAGYLVTDDITVAGFKMPFTFGLANETSDDFNHFPFDGILGLSMSKGATENFVQELVKEDVLDSNLFGVYLSRSVDNDMGGEISFGSVNKDKYTGDISYTSIDSEHNDEWVIPVDDFAYDGHAAGISSKLAYIDTGTSFAFGPPDDIKALHDQIDGATSDDGVTYTVPCDSDKDLTVKFSGKSYAISAKDWRSSPSSSGICTSNIYGLEVVSGSWLLGDLFLKNVYAVFDIGNKRIGFATRPKVSSTSPTTSSSTATSTTGTAGSSSSPGVSGHETSTVTGTAIADSAHSSVSPTASSPGEQLDTSPMYTIVCIVAVIVALA